MEDIAKYPLKIYSTCFTLWEMRVWYLLPKVVVNRVGIWCTVAQLFVCELTIVTLQSQMDFSSFNTVLGHFPIQLADML